MEEIELLRVDNKYNKNTIYYESTLSAVDVDIDHDKKMELYKDGENKTNIFFDNLDNVDSSDVIIDKDVKEKCDKETQIYLK